MKIVFVDDLFHLMLSDLLMAEVESEYCILLISLDLLQWSMTALIDKTCGHCADFLDLTSVVQGSFQQSGGV